MTISSLFRLLRPYQWVKNLFVFIPVFFGGHLNDMGSMRCALLSFIAFSLAASAIYCLNDIIDVDADRNHSVKCHRPIASGAVSIAQAYLMMTFMLLLSVVPILLLGEGRVLTAVIIVGYVLINIAYCTKLKQYAILDVCIISLGFVMRVMAGGVSTGIEPSKWLVLMTFLLALFLSLAKRRDDVLRMEVTGIAPRKNTHGYNLAFINQAITVLASVMVVCYVMYTVSPEVTGRLHNDFVYLTCLPVVVGILRYLQITLVFEQSGSPTHVMLRDRFMQSITIVWLLAFGVIIYC